MLSSVCIASYRVYYIYIYIYIYSNGCILYILQFLYVYNAHLFLYTYVPTKRRARPHILQATITIEGQTHLSPALAMNLATNLAQIGTRTRGWVTPTRALPPLLWPRPARTTVKPPLASRRRYQACLRPTPTRRCSVENGRKNYRSDPFRFPLLYVRFCKFCFPLLYVRLCICGVPFLYLRKWEIVFSGRFCGISFSPEIDPYLFHFLSRFKYIWDM
jgi:hypothetical protein